jgi:predicted lactoylglutathione lyase
MVAPAVSDRFFAQSRAAAREAGRIVILSAFARAPCPRRSRMSIPAVVVRRPVGALLRDAASDLQGTYMTKMIFASLPVADLPASIAFYEALGFTRNPQFSDDSAACMVWSESIYAMLLTHAKWRTFTDRPLPPKGSAGVMLSLSLENRAAVDEMNRAAASHGGLADVNPVQDLGFMYSRDLSDLDGHLWGAFWMDPAAAQGGAHAEETASAR